MRIKISTHPPREMAGEECKLVTGPVVQLEAETLVKSTPGDPGT